MNWPGSKRKHAKTSDEKFPLSNPNKSHKKHDSSRTTMLQANERENDLYDEKLQLQDNEDIALGEYLSDTELAVESLKQRRLCLVLSCSRVSLRHMLDYVLDHGQGTSRSRIERELSKLCSSNKVRRFQLVGDDVGVVSIDDYLAEARYALQNNNDAYEAFTAILSNFRAMGVTHKELISFILKGSREEYNTSMTLTEASKIIDSFVASSLLRPRREKQTHHVLAYWFTIPGLKQTMKWLVDGREEVLLKIKRSMYKEVSRKLIENQSMKSSNLGGEFHVRDLLAKGKIYSNTTASGEFLKIVRS